MLSITPSVSAQNIPDLLDAGTTPDSFAYGFKRLFEALDLAFTFNENDKVVKHIKFAELRLSEAISVVLKGMPEFVDGLTRDYDKQISDANKIAGLAENANDRETLSELVVVITSKHLEVLDKIKDIVPEQAKEKISSLKEIAIRGSTEALKNLAQENPQRSAVLVTDMAESRANAAKQASQKGNPEDAREAAEEYKKISQVGEEIVSIAKQIGKDHSMVQELIENAKSIHVTILQQAMDNVPENAKSVIQDAIDKSQSAKENEVKGTEQSDDAKSTADDEKPDVGQNTEKGSEQKDKAAEQRP